MAVWAEWNIKSIQRSWSLINRNIPSISYNVYVWFNKMTHAIVGGLPSTCNTLHCWILYH